jgi:hypothetical protein
LQAPGKRKLNDPVFSLGAVSVAGLPRWAKEKARRCSPRMSVLALSSRGAFGEQNLLGQRIDNHLDTLVVIFEDISELCRLCEA